MRFTTAVSKGRTPITKNYWIWIFISCLTFVGVNSLVGTTNISNWLLENTLTILFLIVITASYKRFKFSDLSYLLICMYLMLHIYGSKYTYAENPFGYYLKDIFNGERNQYDRIVHFSFGLLLAYPMRELFLRWFKFSKIASWILPIEITLSISGLYELIEWSVADIFFKAQGDAYLGTQGDIWDAQKDMFMAFLGAIIATTIVSSIKWGLKKYADAKQ
ncbi:DUF2238 domain-containing protein [Williamwhitmania taraxaci]|uniref:Putative membrane protein n=1 Tax=Williamwhitmania taraxaci TaxID=1640674 RepID=A0A1G6GVK5_9BACT|nr:DUF2238 domain-containing protein [Williamwhitmania taraxaci]SDB85893.1 putative membrane protein [Williamwhitmania taraxaci]